MARPKNNDLQYNSPLTEIQKENTPSTSKTRSKALSSQPTMPSHEPLGCHSFPPAPFYVFPKIAHCIPIPHGKPTLHSRVSPHTGRHHLIVAHQLSNPKNHQHRLRVQTSMLHN